MRVLKRMGVKAAVLFALTAYLEIIATFIRIANGGAEHEETTARFIQMYGLEAVLFWATLSVTILTILGISVKKIGNRVGIGPVNTLISVLTTLYFFTGTVIHLMCTLSFVPVEIALNIPKIGEFFTGYFFPWPV